MNPLGDREQGSITVLSIGVALLALTLVLVVAGASAVHLDRKRLLALADGMATEAATAVDLAAYYEGTGEVPVSDGTVRQAAAEHLARAPAGTAGRLDGVRIVAPTGTPDGRTAQVSLAAVTRPPLVPWVLLPWTDGIALRVTSTATTVAPPGP